MPEREEIRGRLTNEAIKRDLRGDARRFLLGGIISTPIVLALAWAAFCILWKRERGPLFWLAAAMLGAAGIAVLTGGLFNLYRGIRYYAAARRARFTVTENRLGAKKEGRQRFYIGLFTRLPKPHTFIFHGAVYKTPVEAQHFSRWKDLSMNSWELFNQSKEGDEFYLVSLRPGKPVLIYPQDLFEYTDVSPL